MPENWLLTDGLGDRTLGRIRGERIEDATYDSVTTQSTRRVPKLHLFNEEEANLLLLVADEEDSKQ